ncbi:hypothetical protein A33Q_4415 [Indibacter alkaliphilus LW1]|jgi:amino acid transporter|uniref:Uncharacterized protein n=1 Tax=Indibacter alkaliphilus (strain CCUG 57479 / KCTC 22604 / LW1) TaxID=1189612 RepID=S2CYT8_INDAL|nr:hypothetical protein [Indibacter alkaliphilus]EOZ92322.1 hypothetical protein A33Q_4415 [Indibacter alkaliphilus LW1]
MNFDQSFKHPAPVNTGDWFITILITNIPLIGFIMLIVWAFDKEGNPSKANWAKAKLIWYLVGLGVVILFFMLLGFGFVSGIFEDLKLYDF